MSASSSDLPVSHERFVSADWLASHLNDSSITLIDARMLPPATAPVIFMPNTAPVICLARFF